MLRVVWRGGDASVSVVRRGVIDAIVVLGMTINAIAGGAVVAVVVVVVGIALGRD